ncbi:OpgC domain-containing protein [Leptospira sp. 96542]|nr:OpgC domain-containing protein [Leptospira sp. 96542]
MERRHDIDALRGLLLVLMLLTHLPTRLTMAMGQPLGFVSAAEGFVLLSAWMSGLVYGRPDGRLGQPAMPYMRQAFWRRAFQLYGYQVALLLFLFTAVAAIGMRTAQPAITNMLGFYQQAPAEAAASALLLIYQPPLLDILPLYVVFLLLSPGLLAAAHRHGWRPVLGLSLLIWLLTQFGLSEIIYAAASAVLPISVPYADSGAFSIWAWQFIWVLGLWLGASLHHPEQAAQVDPNQLPRWMLAAAAAIVLIGFAWRHTIGQNPFGTDTTLNLLFDKWRLGPLRLINLCALMLLTMRYGPALAARLPRQRWLEQLGAASLQVFCAHLVLVLVLLALLGDHYLHANWRGQAGEGHADDPLAWIDLGDLWMLVLSLGVMILVARARRR